MNWSGCLPRSCSSARRNQVTSSPALPEGILLAALRAVPSRVEIETTDGGLFCNHGDVPRPAGLVLTRCSSLPEGAKVSIWESDPRIALDDLPLMAWIAIPLPSGEWQFRVNTQWATFCGVPAELWKTAVHPDDAVRAIGKWEHAITTGTVYEAENRVKRSDGEWIWFFNRAVPLRGDSGAIVGYLGTQ